MNTDQAYPCEICPYEQLRASGEMGALTIEVYQLLGKNPFLDHPPDWQLVFELAGITSRRIKREIYERVSGMIRMYREHKETTEKAKADVFTVEGL